MQFYPVCDPRSENRLQSERSLDTGGPRSGERPGAIPVNKQSPKDKAKVASPVIPVHRKPIKAGPIVETLGAKKVSIITDYSRVLSQEPTREFNAGAC